MNTQALALIRQVQGIQEYRLGNGLQILLIPDPAKPLTVVNMVYRVGSQNERYGQTGLAHLLEHLVFRGTERFPDTLKQFAQQGLNANASTALDRTNYYAVFNSQPDSLAWYLNWQADIMQNLRIDQAELDTEVGVILSEADQGNNEAFQVLFQRMRSSAYVWSNYRNSTIGAKTDLLNLSAEDVQEFYHNYYQPDNATLVMAGDFPLEETIALVSQIFAPIAKPNRVLRSLHSDDSVQDGERNVILRQGTGSPLVASMYHIPSALSTQNIHIDLAIQMLSEQPAGLLYRKLMQDTHLVSHAMGYCLSYRHSGTAFFLAHVNQAEDMARAQEALNQLLENLAEQPFTQAELDRVKAAYLNQSDQLLDNAAKLCLSLSDSIALGDWRLFFIERDRVTQTTLAQVQAAAQAYFVASNRTSGQFLPDPHPQLAPEPEPIQNLDFLEHYEWSAATPNAEAFDSSPANIEAHTKIHDLTLNNGKIKLALLHKSSTGERVVCHYRIKFSTLAGLSGQSTLSSMAASLILSGSEQLNQQAIQDLLDSYGARINYRISANQLVVSVNGKQNTFNQVLQLSLNLIRQADYPLEPLEQFKQQVTSAIKTNSAEPAAQSMMRLNQYLHPYAADDFRRYIDFSEQIKIIQSITSEQLRQFNRLNFGSGQIEMAVVGSFNEASLINIVQQCIGSWSQAPAYEYIANPYFERPAQHFTKSIPHKSNAIYSAKALFPLQSTDPRYPALLLANYLLGGSQTSRLFKEVREDKGLSYSIQSTVNCSAFEPSGEWVIQAIFSPENQYAIAQAIEYSLAQALQQGFCQDELDLAINHVLSSRALARSQDSYIAASWLRYMERGQSFLYNLEFDQLLRETKLSEVNQMLREFLRFEQLSIAIMGDFKSH